MPHVLEVMFIKGNAISQMFGIRMNFYRKPIGVVITQKF